MTESNGRPQRVALYARVSSEEQADKGTIANQLDFGRRYAGLHEMTIAGVYADEGVSGALAVEEREQGARLLADAKAGAFSMVLVYRVDRFARSTLHLLRAHEELSRAGVALRSMTEPFDTVTPLGQFVMTLLGSLAALERSTILERSELGKARALRDGRWLGGPPPFGYRVEERRLVVDEEEATLVRRIFHLYRNEGLGLVPIAELLNAEGVPSVHERRGERSTRWPAGKRKWNIGTLARILHNTAYAGTYVAHKRSPQEPVSYAVPPIISTETFEAVQRLLRERLVEAARNARRLYLLRGLIRCHCGRVVVGDGHRAKQRFYYRCPLGHFSARAEALEEVIWADVVAFAAAPGEVVEKLRARLGEQAQAGQAAEAELERLAVAIGAKETEADGIITLYRKGRISEEQLGAQLDEIEAEKATLERRRAEVFDRRLAAQEAEAALLSAEAVLERLQERLREAEAEPEHRRHLIKALVAGIAVAEDGALEVTYRFDTGKVVRASACRNPAYGSSPASTRARSA